MTAHAAARQRARDRAADGIATREEVAVIGKPGRRGQPQRRRIHYGAGGPPCGTQARYKRGCRCDPCRTANTVAARAAALVHRLPTESVTS